MEIIVLGTGCANCKNLERQVINALTELDFIADVRKEEDIVKIMSYGIPRTPGLVIDGKVVLAGRVPNLQEMKDLIQRNK